MGRNMIGVILWSDPDDMTAVIWCEDHGDLAYLSSPENTRLPDRFFEVGDMVEFEVSTQRNLRLAQNTKHLATSFGTTLKSVLKASASRERRRSEVNTTGPAKIIPFRVSSTKATTSPSEPVRRRI